MGSVLAEAGRVRRGSWMGSTSTPMPPRITVLSSNRCGVQAKPTRGLKMRVAADKSCSPGCRVLGRETAQCPEVGGSSLRLGVGGISSGSGGRDTVVSVRVESVHTVVPARSISRKIVIEANAQVESEVARTRQSSLRNSPRKLACTVVWVLRSRLPPVGMPSMNCARSCLNTTVGETTGLVTSAREGGVSGGIAEGVCAPAASPGVDAHLQSMVAMDLHHSAEEVGRCHSRWCLPL